MREKIGKANKVAPVFKYPFDESIGRGQDSVVFPFRGNDAYVVKVNHSFRKEVTSPEMLRFRESELQYKKRKYEILSYFLGRFVPRSFFALGEQKDGVCTRLKGYTIQKRVPDVKFSDLTDEQLNDPRLIRNMHELITKLISMNRMVDRVNRNVPPEAQIDVRLDLGSVSRIVDNAQRENQNSVPLDAQDLALFKSPNVLIDPKSMDVYCVDFGRGVWSDEKEATALLLASMAQREKELKPAS